MTSVIIFMWWWLIRKDILIFAFHYNEFSMLDIILIAFFIFFLFNFVERSSFGLCGKRTCCRLQTELAQVHFGVIYWDVLSHLSFSVGELMHGVWVSWYDYHRLLVILSLLCIWIGKLLQYLSGCYLDLMVIEFHSFLLHYKVMEFVHCFKE